MKFTLSFLFFTFTLLIAGARNYYISASGNDANSGTSSSSPWKSISKVNSASSGMAAGDSILFRRGDVFYGGLIINKSGSSSSPIVVSAYGTGAKPVISGTLSASGWTSAGTNLWRSSAISAAKAVNVLTVNNVGTAKGRYPNANAASSGYLYYESVSGTSSITDNQLSSSPNWKGAEIVIKPNPWTLDRFPITGHSGGTLTFTGNRSTIRNYQGYFIQNSLKTLDQQNEWFFDVSTKQVTMYSTYTPSNVRVSNLDILCLIDGRSYITIKGLEFQGANKDAISLSGTMGIKIDGCTISNSGSHAIAAEQSDKPVIQYNDISNSYSMGIALNDNRNSNAIVKFNKVTKSGSLPGMSPSIEGNGISISGSGHTLEGNTVDSSAYSGIKFMRGSNLTIKNNVINTYCYVMSDGGGIYSWNNEVPATTYYNNKIIGNIIMNGVGITDGTSASTPDADGIYMDDNVGNVEIRDNTVTGVVGAGMYIHNNFNMNITGNTMYNNTRAQLSFSHNLAYVNGVLSSYTTPLRNITFKKNIVVSKELTQKVFTYASILNDISSMGTLDSNYYARPLDDNNNIDIYPNTSSYNKLNLPSWKAFSTKDKYSKKSPVAIPPYIISGVTGSNMLSYGQFTSSISGLTTYSSNKNHKASWDNSSKITGTGSLKLTFNTSAADKYVSLYSGVGAISSSKNYVLRFTTVGTSKNGTVRAYLRKNGSPYTTLAPIQIKTFGTTKTVHEFGFVAPISESNGSFIIEVEQNSGTVYIDDMQFYQGTVTTTKTDEYIRFELNTGSTSKTVSLGSNTYLGIDSTKYSGSITLAPYSSKILLKISSGTASRAAAVQDSSVAIQTDSSTAVPEALMSTMAITETAISESAITTDSLVGATAVTDSVVTAAAKQVVKMAAPAAISTLRISCFPNPSTTQFTLLAEGKTGERITIQVFNTEGRMVYQNTVANNNRYSFGKNLTAGIYILRVTQGNNIQTLKLVKGG